MLFPPALDGRDVGGGLVEAAGAGNAARTLAGRTGKFGMSYVAQTSAASIMRPVLA